MINFATDNFSHNQHKKQQDMKTMTRYLIAIVALLCFCVNGWANLTNQHGSPLTVTVLHATYNGTAQMPVVIVTDGSEILPPRFYNVDINQIGGYTNAGTYQNAVRVVGNQTEIKGDVYADFVIEKRNINLCTVTGNSVVYTGGNITPTITVREGSTPLTLNTDYTATLPTQSAVGTYSEAIVIQGKGNYTGTKKVDFIIAPGTATDIATAVVTSSVTYTGSAQPPSATNVTVKIGSTTLTEGTDFTISKNGIDADYIDAKTYANAIVITGKGGSYYGSLSADYVIARRDLQDVTFTEASKMAWTGSSITPNINAASDNNITAQYAATPYNLVAADYTYTSEPTSIKDPGEYTLTFEGRGNFMGTKQMTVHVLKSFSSQGGDVTLDLTNGSIILPKDGTLTTADITVKDGTTELVEGTDYTAVIYTKSDKSAFVASITDSKDGIYWIELTGKDDHSWTGSKLIEFCVLNEYYVKGNTQLDDASRVCSLHLTEANKAALGTANTDPVIAADATELTIPATATITLKDEQGVGSTSTTKVVGIVDIEDDAFNGCSTLRFIDATEVTSFVPSSLNREATATPFYGLPKQTLVYLTGPTVGGENYIYKIAASTYRCDVYTVYDDVNGNQQGFDDATAAKWDVTIPIGFKANTVTNTRILNATESNKQQGYTVCLPYALPIPASVKAYTLAYSKSGMVGFKEVTGTLAAMTPYVLIPSVSSQPLNTSDATVSQTYNVATSTYMPIAETGSAAVSGQGLYKLYGTMQYMPGSTDYYIMQANNVWNQCKAEDYPKSCVLPMRAYIKANGSAARLYSTFDNADGSTTVVKGLLFDADAAGEIYDLQGRKVTAPQRSGLYIIDGKKTVVK